MFELESCRTLVISREEARALLRLLEDHLCWGWLVASRSEHQEDGEGGLVPSLEVDPALRRVHRGLKGKYRAVASRCSLREAARCSLREATRVRRVIAPSMASGGKP
ncbi:MAG: hypothetical protein C4301_02530 [Thermus sp.]